MSLGGQLCLVLYCIIAFVKINCRKHCSMFYLNGSSYIIHVPVLGGINIRSFGEEIELNPLDRSGQTFSRAKIVIPFFSQILPLLDP